MAKRFIIGLHPHRALARQVVNFAVQTPWAPGVAPTTFYKELVHVGTFTPKEDLVVTITAEDLQHWLDTFRRYQENGLEVPIYVGHIQLDDDQAPEKRRGTLRDMWLQANAKGAMALYGKIEFDSPEAAELKSSQVSINSVPWFVDGKGRSYERPLTHVAITDIPVVPGLEPFVALSLSLAPSKFINNQVKKENTMDLLELAALLGLTIEEGADDQTIRDLITTKLKELTGGGGDGGTTMNRDQRRAMAKQTRKFAKRQFAQVAGGRAKRFDLGTIQNETKVELLEELIDDLPPEEVMEVVEDFIDIEDFVDGSEGGGSSTDTLMSQLQGDDKKKNGEDTMSLSLQKKVISLSLKDRAHTIRNLIENGHITPAIGKDMVALYCTAKSVLAAGSEIAFSNQVALFKKLPSQPRAGKSATPFQNPSVTQEEKSAMDFALGRTITLNSTETNVY